jgi:hypothetical protein
VAHRDAPLAIDAHSGELRACATQDDMNSSLGTSPDNAAEFTWQHDDVFGRIASRYDLLCDVFSLGIHRLWKRRVARRIAEEPWATLLDGATGTGHIVLRLLAHESTAGRRVIASDISPRCSRWRTGAWPRTVNASS